MNLLCNRIKTIFQAPSKLATPHLNRSYDLCRIRQASTKWGIYWQNISSSSAGFTFCFEKVGGLHRSSSMPTVSAESQKESTESGNKLISLPQHTGATSDVMS